LSLFSSPLFCAHISVLIIETGLRDGNPARFGGMMEMWETGLLDVFFEEGHIVTNAQAFALKRKPGKELTGAIKGHITEAKDAGVDYFVLAYLNYEMDAAVNVGRSSALPKPANIEFNLFAINSNAAWNPASAAAAGSKCIWTQTFDLMSSLRRGGYPADIPAENEQTRVRKTARSLIAHLGDFL
jgi:hypothetical protein